LTRFVRRLGDLTTRHDRYEPDLNTSDPNQPSDTTTPRAIAETTGKLVVGDVLSSSSRRLLQDWLLANTTGGKRLRAGFPLGWRIGEKTGTDPSVGANDVGVAWPPDGAPLLVSAYVETTSVSQETRDATIATVAKLAASLMESTTQARSWKAPPKRALDAPGGRANAAGCPARRDSRKLARQSGRSDARRYR